MNKDSIFFSLHSVSSKVPKSRRFYYKSNKNDSVNLLNYIIDAHSFDDVGSTPFSLLNVHDNKIYDSKKGYVDFDKIPPVHKNSYIFSGIVSFDENLSNSDVFKMHWEDISNLIFNTFVEFNDFNKKDWEMQSNMHFNTPNKHIQFRMYQNDKTEPEDLYNRYYIPNKCIKLIKQRVFNFVASKSNLNIKNYPHLLKNLAMKGYNNRIRENRNMIQDFLDILKSDNLNDKHTKSVLLNISEVYFKRTIFNKWLESITKDIKLNKIEHDNIKNIIINNISDGLYSFIRQNRNQKVFDFVSKPDPNDKNSKDQKFKNYDNINHQADFEKLTQYSSSLVKKVYKEPMSRFIDYVLKANHCNIPEVETAISNYIANVKPDYKEKIEITKIHQAQNAPTMVQLLEQNIKTFDKKNINFNLLTPVAKEYYSKVWLSQWVKLWADKNKIPKTILAQIEAKLTNVIAATIHLNISRELTKNPNSIQNIIKNILSKQQWMPLAIQTEVKKLLDGHNYNIEFIPIRKDVLHFTEEKCIENWDPKEIDYQTFDLAGKEYFSQSWLKQWISQWVKTNNISSSVAKEIEQAVSKEIGMNIHYSISECYWNEQTQKHDKSIKNDEILKILDSQDQWVPSSLKEAVISVLDKHNISNIKFIPNKEDLLNKKRV